MIKRVKRKIIITLTMVLALCLLAFSLTACGEKPCDHVDDGSGYCTLCDQVISTPTGVMYRLSEDGTCAEVVKYEGVLAEIVIASEYNGLPVKTIRENAFQNCSSLKSIVIPNSVTSVGSNAFSGCSIEKATMPLTALSLVKNDNLKEVIITSGSAIGDSAFRGLASLESVVLPDSITSIGANAFRKSANLKRVQLSEDLTRIGEWAFSECALLESITLGDFVNSLGEGAFYGCSSLESIVIPDGVQIIEKSLLKKCSSLKEVKLGDSVERIGDSAFEDCFALEEIIIPDGVSVVGDSAFDNCKTVFS